MSNGHEATKHLLRSRTIIGFIVLAISFVVRKLDLNVAEEEIQSIAQLVVELVGLVLVFWGRYKVGDLHVKPKGIPGLKGRAPVFALLSVVALTLTGCGTTPEARWAEQRQALTLTQDGLVAANAAGWLEDEDFVATSQYVRAARTALDRAESFLPAGGGFFEQYLTLVVDSLDALRAIQHEAEQEGIDNGTGSNLGPDPGGQHDLQDGDDRSAYRTPGREDHRGAVRGREAPGEPLRRGV